MAERTRQKQREPDIFALMRADPSSASRDFTETENALIRGEGFEFFVRCMMWTDCFVLPSRFAAKRRAEGDPAASARDHECGCDVLNNSCAPVCEKRRPACQFERPPGPPTTFMGGVPYEPPKAFWPRSRYAARHARAAFLAYADAAPAMRRKMERQVERALCAPRARAFIAALFDGAGTRRGPRDGERGRVTRPSASPPSAQNR